MPHEKMTYKELLAFKKKALLKLVGYNNVKALIKDEVHDPRRKVTRKWLARQIVSINRD